MIKDDALNMELTFSIVEIILIKSSKLLSDDY